MSKIERLSERGEQPQEQPLAASNAEPPPFVPRPLEHAAGYIYDPTDPPQAPYSEADPRSVDWRAIATQAVEALRLTREYVGEEMLPALEERGWSWYDATQAYNAAVTAEDGVSADDVEEQTPAAEHHRCTRDCIDEVGGSMIGHMTLAEIYARDKVKPYFKLWTEAPAGYTKTGVWSASPDTEHVDHPQHYNEGDICCRECGAPIECIDVIEGMDLPRGTAIKHIWRAPYKGAWVEDLKKAAWYLQREADRMESEE